ncbi:MAG TPA: cobalamin-binding protein [Acidobacteriota bacterium]|nr:cobalamin-binding protein [Acidobacteriota bacterium]
MKRVWLLVTVISIAAALGALLVAVRSKPVPLDPVSGKRIISLAPSLTETLFALGVGDQLVGVTSYCNYPAEAKAIEKVGDFINPSLEKIVSLRPDLILAEHWSSSKISKRLSQLGLEVVETTSPSSIDQVYELIRQVGEATGRNREADKRIAEMKERIAAARLRAARFRFRPSIYVEIDPPSWTVGRRSYTSEAILIAGGRNLFDDVNRPSLLVSKEMVLQKDPDVILSFVAKADEIRARPGWADLRAVREGRIIDDFNRDLLSRGTFRLVEGIEQLQQRLEGMQ